MPAPQDWTKLIIHPSAFRGAQVTVAPDAEIGPNCYLDGRIEIGSRSRLIGGVIMIGDARIGENCIIEPNVSITGSLETEERPETLNVGPDVRIGAGSVLASGITIGPGAQIDAGTVVTRNVPAYAVVRGNPASIITYKTTPTAGAKEARPPSDNRQTVIRDCSVAGVKVFEFPRIRDLRGDLSIGEFGRNVPFYPKRYFVVFDVPSAETRGEHAHRECEQFLLCTNGKVAVLVDDGHRREEIELAAPNLGLYIPPRIWALQYKYSSASTLLVFASHYYDPDDYIRDYDCFLKECAQAPHD